MSIHVDGKQMFFYLFTQLFLLTFPPSMFILICLLLRTIDVMWEIRNEEREALQKVIKVNLLYMIYWGPMDSVFRKVLEF